MTKFHIKQAQVADWQSFRDVRFRALAESPDAFGSTLAEDQAESDDSWIARVKDVKVAQFIATTPSGDPLGIAVGAPYDGVENTAGLFSMWVAPEFRGLRIGSDLVEAVIAWARSASYGRIILDVADENTAAIRLYESKGFVPTGQTGTLPPPRQHITEQELALSLK